MKCSTSTLCRALPVHVLQSKCLGNMDLLFGLRIKGADLSSLEEAGVLRC